MIRLCAMLFTAATAAVPLEFAPVTNGGFEEGPTDAAVPPGWRFGISREAKCTMVLDDGVAKSGKVSVRFHNESPLAPHVYGRFSQTVPVKPATGYTLSVWVRGRKVAGGQHLTDWRTYTLSLPSGTFDWTRAETTFVTKEDQRTLELGLNVVNVCDALWIDEVELKADVTAVEVPAGVRGSAAFWCPREAQGDDVEVPVELYLDLPAGFRGRAAVRLTAGGQVVASNAADVTGEMDHVNLPVRSSQTPSQDLVMEVSLADADGKALGEGERTVRKYSAATAASRLTEVEGLMPRLRERVAEAGRRNVPADYPTVTLTVCESFIGYAKEDIGKGEIRRAQEAADEMVEMARRATLDLEQTLAGKRAPAPVPRYRTSAIDIVGGHFVADTEVTTTGQRERRPVFFNGYGHFAAVRRDIEKFPAYGTNIIQIEFGPNSVFPQEGVTSEAAIDDFLLVLDRAAKSNVAVNLLLSPHYFPAWALEKWPELTECSGGFIRFCIDAPQARDIEERFLRTVIPRIKGRPGLHSLCLSNEPIYTSSADCAHTRELWAKWLAKRHGDVATLNRRHGTAYGSFSEVAIPPADPVVEEPGYCDWCLFNQERFAGWHQWMADTIHWLAPEIPVHAKIMPTIWDRHTIAWGVDPELFCDLSQIAGNDCWKMYSGTGEWADGWQTENMFYDLLRSMLGQPVFNSENHLITDRDTAYKPPVHVRNVLWQGAVHGQGATTIWVWERTFDPKSDFSGSIMHRPGCAEAVGRTNLDLLRLSREVVALQSRPAEVAILYSVPSIVYSQEYLAELSRAYEALNFTGRKTDFISERQIAAGKAKEYRLIVVPAAVSVSDETFAGLSDFARRGGRLAVISEESLGLNEYKQTRDAAGLLKDGACSLLPKALDPPVLRGRLLEALRDAGGREDVQVKDVKTGQLPWGVEWLSAREGGRTVVNLVNYTNEEKRVRIAVPGGRRLTNLFTGERVPGTVALPPLEPLLVAG